MEYFTLYKVSKFILPLVLISSGVAVLVRKKPLILDSRWIAFILAIAVFLPLLARPYPGESNMFFLLLVIAGMVFLFFTIGRYSIFGANADDFHTALIASLKEEGVDFEESFLSIKVKDPLLEFSIAFHPWTGNGQIRLKTKSGKDLLTRLVNKLPEKKIGINWYVPSIHLVAGVVLLYLQLSLPVF